MSEFSKARKIMAKELEDDPGLREAYRANIAMLLHDRFNRVNFKNYEMRNGAAEEILKLIFSSSPGKWEEEPKSTPRYMAPRPVTGESSYRPRGGSLGSENDK